MTNHDPNPDGVVMAPAGTACPMCGATDARLVIGLGPMAWACVAPCAEAYFGTVIIVPPQARGASLRHRAKACDALVATLRMKGPARRG